jgi:hypothetical protein
MACHGLGILDLIMNIYAINGVFDQALYGKS